MANDKNKQTNKSNKTKQNKQTNKQSTTSGILTFLRNNISRLQTETKSGLHISKTKTDSHLLMVFQAEGELLEHLDDCHLGFHHGEHHADTLAWSSTKGQEGVGLDLVFVLAGKSEERNPFS